MKKYNTEFGDVLPLAAANVFNVRLTIFNKCCESQLRTVHSTGRKNSTLPIVIPAPYEWTLFRHKACTDGLWRCYATAAIYQNIGRSFKAHSVNEDDNSLGALHMLTNLKNSTTSVMIKRTLMTNQTTKNQPLKLIMNSMKNQLMRKTLNMILKMQRTRCQTQKVMHNLILYYL